ncbi:hypothetical protein ACFQY5_20395 [Paeniroseomonas aquatica]|uniref:hypothetical protein n=1 Tax=Paeniroseomonas aquatica TaxID=373043 RepID=UPI0036092969
MSSTQSDCCGTIQALCPGGSTAWPSTSGPQAETREGETKTRSMVWPVLFTRLNRFCACAGAAPPGSPPAMASARPRRSRKRARMVHPFAIPMVAAP